MFVNDLPTTVEQYPHAAEVAFARLEEAVNMVLPGSDCHDRYLGAEAVGLAVVIAKDLNDTRVQSEDKWDRNKASKSVEQNVKDLEKQFYAESGESQKREKIKATADEAQQKIKLSTSAQTKSKSEVNSSGGNTAFKGKTMVSWELKGREPHQGNEWYVRNPGYTCGHDSNGEVYIKIKVNSSGSVLSATYLPEMSRNATACMVEQARKYALMSRFNFSQSSTSQDGKIIYTFITQ